MKRFLFICLSFVFAIAMTAQSAFKQNRADGIVNYEAKKYERARKFFIAAKACPDCPQKNDLASWIAKCDKAIKAKENAKKKQEEERKKKPKKETSPTQSKPLLVNGENECVSLMADAAGEVFSLHIENSSENYKVQNYPEWISVEKDDSLTFYIEVAANRKKEIRETSFEVRDAAGVVTINVKQEAHAPVWKIEGTTHPVTSMAKEIPALKNIVKTSQYVNGAITSDGRGVLVLDGTKTVTSDNLPTPLQQKLKEIAQHNYTINAVSITRSGKYCVVYDKNGWYGEMPESMVKKLTKYADNGENIYCVTMNEIGDYVILTDKSCFASDGFDLENIKYAEETYGQALNVCITTQGCCIVCEDGIYYDNIPENLEKALQQLPEPPVFVTFTDNGTYLICGKSGWNRSEL